jgi:hypothetical protein
MLDANSTRVLRRLTFNGNGVILKNPIVEVYLHETFKDSLRIWLYANHSPVFDLLIVVYLAEREVLCSRVNSDNHWFVQSLFLQNLFAHGYYRPLDLAILLFRVYIPAHEMRGQII